MKHGWCLWQLCGQVLLVLLDGQEQEYRLMLQFGRIAYEASGVYLWCCAPVVRWVKGPGFFASLGPWHHHWADAAKWRSTAAAHMSMPILDMRAYK